MNLRESTSGAREGEGRTALVTGATGALGPAVVAELLAGGWRVRSLSAAAPPERSPAREHPFTVADINDREALRETLRGIDVVVHMAALLHVERPGPELEAEYVRVNVEGTRSVVEEAAAAGVRQVVLLSSICVYGPQVGMVTEDATPRPETFYARTKLAAEEIVVHARAADGRPLGTALRLGAVYGASLKGNYERLVRVLARGRFLPVGEGLNRRTLVYEKDVAAAIRLVAAGTEGLGRVFNVTDGRVHTVRAITDAICGALGRRSPRWSIPVGAAKAAVRIAEAPFRVAGVRPPVSRATIEKYLEDIAVSGEAFQSHCGFAAGWNLEDGWRETVEGMRHLGRL